MSQIDAVKRNVARVTIKGAAIFGLATLLVLFWHTLLAPGHPDIGTGKIYDIGIRGHWILTWAELRLLIILVATTIALATVSASLGWPFSDDSYEKARATYGKTPGSDGGV